MTIIREERRHFLPFSGLFAWQLLCLSAVMGEVLRNRHAAEQRSPAVNPAPAHAAPPAWSEPSTSPGVKPTFQAGSPTWYPNYPSSRNLQQMKPRAGLRQFAFALLARVTYQSKAKDIQLSLSQAMTKLRQDAGRSASGSRQRQMGFARDTGPTVDLPGRRRRRLNNRRS